jgi:hypothetical protein
MLIAAISGKHPLEEKRKVPARVHQEPSVVTIMGGRTHEQSRTEVW